MHDTYLLTYLLTYGDDGNERKKETGEKNGLGTWGCTPPVLADRSLCTCYAHYGDYVFASHCTSKVNRENCE